MLNGSPTPLPPPHQALQTPEPPKLPESAAAMLPRGAALFFTYCVFCHSGQGEARLSAYPDLFRLNSVVHGEFQDIVRGGKLKANGMASFADVLSEEDAAAIQAFLVQGQAALRAQEQGAGQPGGPVPGLPGTPPPR